MFEQIKLLTEFTEYPFALFQEKVCIFESKIKASDVLNVLSKKLWKNSETDTLTITYFRGLIFLSTKFIINNSNFMLIMIMSEKNSHNWTNLDWTLLLKKVQAYIAILSDTKQLTIKKRHFEIPATHDSEEEKVFTEQTFQTTFTDHYQFEKHLMDALKTSDSLILNKMVHNLSKINQTPLSNNKLLEKKYRFVSLITLVSRAAIQYGCSPTHAYRLSDSLIRQLDFIQATPEYHSLIKQMLNEFSLLIKTNTFSSTSYIVKSAIEYIHQNLYDDLSNSTIAEKIGVHPVYLSSTFKKNTGNSLRHFITKTRVKEAKYLLANTDLALKEISESLHFSNQSYFCKLFKAETTYTPKEYRILF